MALFVRQDDTRTKFQEKLAADLQEKARRNASNQLPPDGVEDAKYMENTKQTTGLAWVWVLILLLIVAVTFYLIFRG